MCPARTHFTCTIEGCSSPHVARGLCSRHWQKWKRNGDPLGGDLPRGTGRRHLSEHVLTLGTDDCYFWPFSKNAAGYGVVFVDGRHRIVSEYVCEKVHGQKPSSAHSAAHNCGMQSCCNPRHLRWATRSENELDKRLHGTAVNGERHFFSKLSDAEVDQIRALSREMRNCELAAKFGISRGHVTGILKGHTRKNRTFQPPLPETERSAA